MILTSGNVRRESGSLVWFEPVEPLGGIGHVVMTTRPGGLSRDPYDALNLGFHVGDVAERVRLNRIAIQKALPRGLQDPVVGDQVHGTVAQTVGRLHSGARWQSNEKALEGTDALVTASRDLPLVTMVADCLPVALVDPERSVAAAIHAGWRGLSDGVIENALTAMKETFGTFASDLVAWLGPCIRECCYEVGPEVAVHFPGSTRPSEGDRSFLDLRDAARRHLADCGLMSENVTGLDLCTSCEADLFFSHRRATTKEGKPTTGRQAMIIWLEREA